MNEIDCTTIERKESIGLTEVAYTIISWMFDWSARAPFSCCFVFFYIHIPEHSCWCFSEECK